MCRRLSLSWLFFLAVVVSFPVGQASATEFQEGVHYSLLSEPGAIDEGGNIEVLEVFQYHCPLCFKLTPLMETWLGTQREDVRHIYLSVGRGKVNRLHARAYYTALSLDRVYQVHSELYRAIHVERKRLNTDQEIADIFVSAGVDRQRFSELFNSEAIGRQVTEALSQAKAYKVIGTPTIIVGRKYRITSKSAGGYEKMLKVVEFLVRKEREAIGEERSP